MNAQRDSQMPRQDRAAAEEFLAALDPTANAFTFQCFDDGPGKSPKLARTFNGPLDEHWSKLCQLSDAGAGIYVTINRTDMKGRRADNIVACRAVFVDADNAPIQNVARLKLIPQWLQQTSKQDLGCGEVNDLNRDKWHAFWFVDGIELNEFTPLQKRLCALLETDRAVVDLPRVMRLPGFANCKRSPHFQVARIKINADGVPARYSRVTFMGALEEAERRLAGGNIVSFNSSARAPSASLKSLPANAALVGFDGRAPYAEELETKLYAAAAYWHGKTSALDDYSVWSATVGLGLFRLGWGDRALALFHRISALSSKYDAVTCDAKWHQLQSSRLPDHPATYVTILNRAAECGWKSTIASSGIEPDGAGDQIDRLNQRYAFLRLPGTVWRFEHGDAVGADQLHLELANELTDERKPRPASRVWLASKRRREHIDVAYRPGDTPITADNYINTWSGWPCEAKDGDVAPFLDLLHHLTSGDREKSNHLLDWFAYPVQTSGGKIRHAVVLHSTETGVGKSTLAEMVGSLYGPTCGVNWTKIGNAQLEATFNSWIAEKLFIVGEEIDVAHNRALGAKLKELITGDVVQLNRKYVSELERPNLANFLFLSNSVTPLHIDRHDRRFFVVHCAEQKLPDELNRRLRDWYAKGGREALMFYLKERDIAGFRPEAPAPDTAEKIAAIDLCRSETERFVADLETSETDKPLRSIRQLRAEAELLGNKISETALGRALAAAGAPQKTVRTVTGPMRVWAVRDYNHWSNASHAMWTEQIARQGDRSQAGHGHQRATALSHVDRLGSSAEQKH